MKNIFNDKNFLGYLIPRFSAFLLVVAMSTLGVSLAYHLAHEFLGMEIRFKEHVLQNDLFKE